MPSRICSYIPYTSTLCALFFFLPPKKFLGFFFFSLRHAMGLFELYIDPFQMAHRYVIQICACGCATGFFFLPTAHLIISIAHTCSNTLTLKMNHMNVSSRFIPESYLLYRNKFPTHSILCISICRICVFVVYRPFSDGT